MATRQTTVMVMTSSVLWSCLLSVVAYSGKRQDILQQLLHGSNGTRYDNQVPPEFEQDTPTRVTVQIYVLSFDSVTEASMEYSMSIFLRQNWSDWRLRWNDSTVNGDRLEVDPKHIPQLWTPDLYFINEKAALVHDVTVVNKLLHIHREGQVQFSMRISMTLSCDMTLERYPHDEQNCQIQIASYSYTSDNVYIQWYSHNSTQPVIMRPGLQLPRFVVGSPRVKPHCNTSYEGGSMIQGRFSCIQADFHLRRQFGYYIVQVYIPSVLIVCLSWLSFWIDIEAVPARVSLGLLTVLAMTTQSQGEKAALPRVSYVKAIDVWLAACLFFVFTALLEFAYVNVCSRVQKRHSEEVEGRAIVGDWPCDGSGGIPQKIQGPLKRQLTQTQHRLTQLRERARKQKARFIDKCARALFPVAFAVFNIFYWIYYKYPSENKE